MRLELNYEQLMNGIQPELNLHISSRNALIALGSSFRCGYVIESIPQLVGESVARGRLASAGNILCFANTRKIPWKVTS
jgi:hypothetical protein